MRRIARPARALDAALPLHACARPRIASSPCTAAAAAFSTSASRAFLLPGGKQDKKKHQQFVRRWQKRLLGDSEPIGAHVDPYDPSSPVRIAPEDQGEELEVLEEDANAAPMPRYKKAKKSAALMHVGNDKWLAQHGEVEMAREFEKLTMRTYTPLSLTMADDIEDLTGTPYTLADDNLFMAQTVHNVTGRPYTNYKYAQPSPAPRPQHPANSFVQLRPPPPHHQHRQAAPRLRPGRRRGLHPQARRPLPRPRCPAQPRRLPAPRLGQEDQADPR